MIIVPGQSLEIDLTEYLFGEAMVTTISEVFEGLGITADVNSENILSLFYDGTEPLVAEGVTIVAEALNLINLLNFSIFTETQQPASELLLDLANSLQVLSNIVEDVVSGSSVVTAISDQVLSSSNSNSSYFEDAVDFLESVVNSNHPIFEIIQGIQSTNLIDDISSIFSSDQEGTSEEESDEGG